MSPYKIVEKPPLFIFLRLIVEGSLINIDDIKVRLSDYCTGNIYLSLFYLIFNSF